jgi:type III secretion protein R
MNPTGSGDLLGMALAIASLSLVPLLVVTCSSFLKIALVLIVLRNAIGVQQVPPTLAIYGIALAMTAFVMAPTLQAVGTELVAITSADSGRAAGEPRNAGAMLKQMATVAEPIRSFMLRYAGPSHREAMLDNARRLWPADFAKDATSADFLILLPAFVISELQAGYEIAFLIYIPFVVIDLLVSNLLMAIGMQSVQATVLTIPLKLLLFIMVVGWSRLLHALALSYQAA